MNNVHERNVDNTPDLFGNNEPDKRYHRRVAVKPWTLTQDMVVWHMIPYATCPAMVHDLGVFLSTVFGRHPTFAHGAKPSLEEYAHRCRINVVNRIVTQGMSAGQPDPGGSPRYKRMGQPPTIDFVVHFPGGIRTGVPFSYGEYECFLAPYRGKERPREQMRLRGIVNLSAASRKRHHCDDNMARPIPRHSPTELLRMMDRGPEDLPMLLAWMESDRGVPVVSPDIKSPEWLSAYRRVTGVYYSDTVHPKFDSVIGDALTARINRFTECNPANLDACRRAWADLTAYAWRVFK